MKKEFLKRAFIGFPFGVTISILISILSSIIAGNNNISFIAPNFIKNEYLNEVDIALINFILSGIVGSISSSSSLIFETNINLLKQTILHILIISLTVLPICVISNWIKLNLLNILVFFLIYILIYITIYSMEKIKINKINKSLNNKLNL